MIVFISYASLPEGIIASATVLAYAAPRVSPWAAGLAALAHDLMHRVGEALLPLLLGP